MLAFHPLYLVFLSIRKCTFLMVEPDASAVPKTSWPFSRWPCPSSVTLWWTHSDLESAVLASRVTVSPSLVAAKASLRLR